MDIAENIARERAIKLFNCEYAYVQPHSGSQANMAAYFTILQPGDTIMGLNLAHGGHLTHGSPVNFSGKLYRAVFYGVSKDTGMIIFGNPITLPFLIGGTLVVIGVFLVQLG